ncbi:Homoserine dehydrogenase [Alphaproteobacteria bacterium SO-S41]|nr:Homoserine dehydrogenase [Alphaproteobacteria bacterium SO-S41]
MSKPLRIGVAGLGTVGGGVVRLLAENGDLIAARCGRRIEVVGIGARDRTKDRGFAVDKFAWFENPVDLAASDIDVFVELIGGEGIAADAVRKALATGKHVVTANKALIAAQGAELAAQAEAAGLTLNFEAAAAGGIPIVKALREGLGGNVVTRVAGILNGTCNYILTQMEETGRPFADVLAEAQALGYAEADPTLDVGGGDTAHKLAILASLAFGTVPDIAGVYTQGIERISPVDIAFANEFGHRIKLLGIAAMTPRGLEARVHPAMVQLGTALADVMGVLNGVVTESGAAGTSVFEGRGAGAGPTASAVVSDLIDIARGFRLPAFGVPSGALVKADRAPLGEREGTFYLRFDVLDKSGVLATIARSLADRGVSIESMIQRGRSPDEKVAIVIITHDAREADVIGAIKAIEAAGAVVEPPCMIRMERL